MIDPWVSSRKPKAGMWMEYLAGLMLNDIINGDNGKKIDKNRIVNIFLIILLYKI